MTHRILRRFPALLALLPLLAACDGEPLQSRDLAGEWRFTTETRAVQWRRDEVVLALDEDGGYLRVHSIFADDGRPGDGLRAYTRHAGTYVLQGDSLFAGISSVEQWDVRDGIPEPRREPGGFGATQRFRARRVGDRLLLEETREVDGQPVTYHHSFRRVGPAGIHPTFPARAPAP